MSLDLAGHFGYILLALGTGLITRSAHRPLGWALRVCGSLTWFIVGVLMCYSSIVVWSVVFALVDMIGALRARGSR